MDDKKTPKAFGLSKIMVTTLKKQNSSPDHKNHYGHKFFIFPKTFQIFQKRTFINVQKEIFKTLLEKLFKTIEFHEEFERFFSQEDGLDN